MRINQAAGSQDVVSFSENTNQKGDRAKKGEAVRAENGSINASKLNFFTDEIDNKRQKAMKDAMGIIKRQFQADLKVDESLKLCQEVTQKAKEELKEAQEGLSIIEAEKAKYEDTESEDYQAHLTDWNKQETKYQEQVQNAKSKIGVMTGVIKGTKQEMLKYHGMNDAADIAKEVLEAAGDQVVGMLTAEAVEKIDKELQEKAEQGQQIQKEQEQKEADLEKIQAEQKKKAEEIEAKAREAAAQSSQNTPFFMTDEMIKMAAKQAEALTAVTKILEEMHLLPEDIKGITVNNLL